MRMRASGRLDLLKADMLPMAPQPRRLETVPFKRHTSQHATDDSVACTARHRMATRVKECRLVHERVIRPRTREADVDGLQHAEVVGHGIVECALCYAEDEVALLK